MRQRIATSMLPLRLRTPETVPKRAVRACSSLAALVEGIERLAWIIQDTHPGPYTRCGGKEAFVAFVGDANTVIHADINVNYSKPGGIPLYFGAVDLSELRKQVAFGCIDARLRPAGQCSARDACGGCGCS